MTLRAHPSLPFECTYHFVRVGANEWFMLDVIRSPRGDSLRMFHVRGGQLLRHHVGNETGPGAARLAATGDRITREGPGLKFDLRFSVGAHGSAWPVAPINPLGCFEITARDHLDVRYFGFIELETNTVPVRFDLDRAPGHVSQHYGRSLPDYLYFCLLDEQAGVRVGAVTETSTWVGLSMRSHYVNAAALGRAPRLGLRVCPRVTIESDADLGRTRVTISTRFGRIELALASAGGLAHEIDHAPGRTWFDGSVSIDNAPPQPALIESRGGWPLLS